MIAKLGDYLVHFLQTAFGVFFSQGQVVIGVLCGVLTCSSLVTSSLDGMLLNALGKLAYFTIPSDVFTWISTGYVTARPYMAFANYVVPLSEMFEALGLLSVLWVAAIAYRFVKSWIPTLS